MEVVKGVGERVVERGEGEGNGGGRVEERDEYRGGK